jgi:putative oxidoreductase
MIRDFALLAARLAVGGGMAAHGAQKALGWFDGPGPEKAAGVMHGLGFRPGTTYAQLAAWNEIAAGLAIAVGLGGPAGPAALISNMIVAQEAVHRKNGFFAQGGGIELGVMYCAASLTFAATGFGALSLDAALGMREKLKHPVLLALSLAGGVAAAYLVLDKRDTTPDGPATPTYQGKNSPLEPANPPNGSPLPP